MNHRFPCLLGLLPLVAIPACGGSGEGSGRQIDVEVVTRGPMTIRIREDAELKAARETRIASEIEGEVNIIFLVDEGEIVRKGDKLVELDVSEIEERRATQAISVERARAALVNAEQNMEILEKELAAEAAEAESAVRIAELDLEKFLGKERSLDPIEPDAAEPETDLPLAAGDDIFDAPPPSPGSLPQSPAPEIATNDEAAFGADSADPGANGVEPVPPTAGRDAAHDSVADDGVAGDSVAGDSVAKATPDTSDPSPDAYGPDVRILSSEVYEARGSNRDMAEALRKQVVDTPYEGLVDKVVGLLGLENLARDMGELGQQVLEQIDQISLARQRLAIAKDTWEHSDRLHNNNYITKNELDRDWLDYESQLSQVKIAWQKLDLLISYTLVKEKIDYELKLSNARIALERTRASANARRQREQAELESSRQEHTLALERLENFDRQLANAVIYAPTNGLVVYAELDRRGREVVEEGIAIRQRQTILILPDVTQMQAELKVHEADIDKVRPGQPAIIELDAFPQQFTGRVTRVSPLPDSGSSWSNNNLKVYKTWVAIDFDNQNSRLRPNMAAKVEIIVGTIPDAIFVSQVTVRLQGAVHYVWKQTPDGPIAQRVKIGRSTLTQVEILEGLNEGDRVYRGVPPGVTPPEFEQPESDPVEAPVLPEEPRNRVSFGLGSGSDPAPEAADAPLVTRESFQAALLQKHPELATVLEEQGMRAFRDPAVQAAIEGDPELRTMSEAMRAQMREQMMRRGGERRGEDGGGPGGRRGGRGDGPRRGGDSGR